MINERENSNNPKYGTKAEIRNITKNKLIRYVVNSRIRKILNGAKLNFRKFNENDMSKKKIK